MTYTAVSTKATGDTISATDWNTYIKDNAADFDARLQAVTFKGAKWTRTTTQSIPDSASTAAQFATAETYDEGGWGLTASNTTITVPSTAFPTGYTTIVVRVIASVEWANNATGRRILDVYKNGVVQQPLQITAGSNISLGMINVSEFEVVVGDTITTSLYQDTGGALNINKGVLTVSRAGFY